MSGITSNKMLKTPAKGALSRLRVEPLDGPKYALELAQRECTECRYLLPQNIEKVPSLTLVVAGDVHSGKSHYIAALIHQLKTELLSKSYGFGRIICLTPDVAQTYTRDYFDPLFTNKEQMPATQLSLNTALKPLIYKLSVSSSPKHPTITTNLMIYDTSGEAFESPENLVRFARFIMNTSAFIFVADPYTMPPFFDGLTPALQNLLRGKKAAERLNTIIDVYGRFHGYTDSRYPDLPIAVMVSKSDLFKPLYQPNKATFMTNPSYEDGISLQDIETVDREVRELLRTHEQGDLIVSTSKFKQVKFFAASATGVPVDASGHFQHVEPCRCLDPVLWILDRLDIIKANR